MSEQRDSEAQLNDALTALSVAERGAIEAVLNRVAAIVATEQLARLELEVRVATLEAERSAR